MTQVWRKISQNILMVLGTLSLLVVVTGLSADLPNRNVLAGRGPLLQPVLADSAFICENEEDAGHDVLSLLRLSSSENFECRNETKNFSSVRLTEENSKQF